MQEGVYVISVAARILDMHPQTLRKYERVGLVLPSRTGGMSRLYSDEDIARLQLIKHLVDNLGLNLAGVKVAMPAVQQDDTDAVAVGPVGRTAAQGGSKRKPGRDVQDSRRLMQTSPRENGNDIGGSEDMTEDRQSDECQTSAGAGDTLPLEEQMEIETGRG